MPNLTLPLVLIGPLLRRVEPRSVSVFVATSAPSAIRLTLYDGLVDAANPPEAHAHVDARTTAFAARFHATVVTVTLAQSRVIQGPGVITITEPGRLVPDNIDLPPGQHTLKLGQQVVVAGQQALLPGHRYSYDLRITPEGGAARTLADLGFLSDLNPPLPGYKREPPVPPDPLHPPPEPDPDDLRANPFDVCAMGYADGQLPSFVTCPNMLEDLVLAHASCRKPHGPGNPAMQYLDDVIDGLHEADAGRPHMLFLTGDQIYADDVAAALLPGLNTLAIALVSGDGDGIEQVPSPSVDGRPPLDASTTVLPPGFRQKLAGMAKFTSEDASSHLVSFGEWLAMYCVAWNPHLWPVLGVADASQASLPTELAADIKLVADIDDDVKRSPEDAPRVLGRPTREAADAVITPLYGASQPAADARKKAFKDFLRDKKQLFAFRREVPKVRRLLANVPTYMICDDHEVTDDWFMTGAIRADTTSNPLARTMIRNALTAFTICQAWGNDPERWAADANRRALLGGMAGMFTGGWHGGLPISAAADAVDRALGPAPPGPLPQFDFSFTVDGPMHRVRVLDTRTRRDYSTRYASPGLLTRDALDTQLPEEVLPEGHVLVVVSPAPVLGPAVMNEIGGLLAVNEHDVATFAQAASTPALNRDLNGFTNGSSLGAQYFDAEHWSAQPAPFERLLARLSHFPRVVVLGGDVHYGAAYAMDWSGAGRDSRIVHFTSSAASNAWFGVVRNLMLLNGMSVGLQRIGMPMTRLGWMNTLPEVVTDTGVVTAGPANEPPLPRIRIQTGPVLLSNELFLHRHALTRPPEWVWSANPIVDVRPPAERPAAARSAGIDTELPADISAVRHYGALAAAHVSGLGSVAIARGLQFLNNVGVIRFGRADGKVRVSQSLYSLRARPEPNERADAYIVHETALEPVPVAVPAAVGPGT